MKSTVVVLPNIDWDFPWQRHQVFATIMSKYAEVFFVENTGFRSLAFKDWQRIITRIRRWSTPTSARLRNPISDGVKIVSPLTLPPGRGLNQKINQWFFIPLLIKRLKKLGLTEKVIFWTYIPTTTSLSIIKELKPATVIYDCATNFYGHPDAPSYLQEIETQLLGQTDVVLTDSLFLFQQYAALHPKVYQIHHGVDAQFFTQANQQQVRPNTLCYFGSIHQHLNWQVIQKLASSGFDVTLIGSVVGTVPNPWPVNVRLLPPVTPDKLAETIAPYQALLLPYYPDTPFMQGVIPAKIYECLATGKAILSSPLPNYPEEFRSLLYLCSNEQDFLDAANSLATVETSEKQIARISLARHYSREVIAEKLYSILMPYL